MKKLLLFPFLILTFGILAQPVEKGSHVSSEAELELRILSWNIYMLPRLVKFTGKRKRAKAIGNILVDMDYDVIVFQEAFHPAARRILRKKLKGKYPYEIGPANSGGFSFRYSSGVWILSRTPMKEIAEITFREKSGFDNRMARKGALMVEVEKEGQEFQIIGTHLNSGGEIELRLSQVHQIREELILAYKRKLVPQVICGDFNISKSTNAHTKMKGILTASDGELLGDLKTSYGPCNDMSSGKGNKLIDYIFYKNNGKIVIDILRRIPTIQFQWHKKHKDLSDHHPIEIVIYW